MNIEQLIQPKTPKNMQYINQLKQRHNILLKAFDEAYQISIKNLKQNQDKKEQYNQTLKDLQQLTKKYKLDLIKLGEQAQNMENDFHHQVNQDEQHRNDYQWLKQEQNRLFEDFYKEQGEIINNYKVITQQKLKQNIDIYQDIIKEQKNLQLQKYPIFRKVQQVLEDIYDFQQIDFYNTEKLKNKQDQ